MNPPEKASDGRRRMVLLRWIAEKRRELHHAWDPSMTPRRVKALTESIQSAWTEVVQIERRWPDLRDPGSFLAGEGALERVERAGAGGDRSPPGESSPAPTSTHGGASDIHTQEAGTRGHTRPLPSPSPGSEATPPQPCPICKAFHTEGWAKDPVTGCDVPDRRGRR